MPQALHEELVQNWEIKEMVQNCRNCRNKKKKKYCRHKLKTKKIKNLIFLQLKNLKEMNLKKKYQVGTHKMAILKTTYYFQKENEKQKKSLKLFNKPEKKKKITNDSFGRNWFKNTILQ